MRMEWKKNNINNTLEGKENERKAFVQHQLRIPAEYIHTQRAYYYYNRQETRLPSTLYTYGARPSAAVLFLHRRATDCSNTIYIRSDNIG